MMQKKWILKKSAESGNGYPKPTMENFECITETFPTDQDLQEGEVLLKHLVLSVDPYVAAYCMGEKYVGKPIIAAAAGTVIASRSPDFTPGDFAMTPDGGATEASIHSADSGKIRKISTEPNSRVPFDPSLISLSACLGILGMPGVTSYYCLKDNIGDDLSGQTIVVTGAAGAVGSTVGQLAKLWGASKGEDL